MRSDWTQLENFRFNGLKGYESKRGDTFGFFIWQVGRTQIRAIAVDGEETGWEHVSVSLLYENQNRKKISRMPTWQEMCWVKDKFWTAEEAVVQFHPPESEYVNNHPHCLHLWKCVDKPFPLPDSLFVGIKSLGLLTP